MPLFRRRREGPVGPAVGVVAAIFAVALVTKERYYRMVLPAASGIEDGLDAGAIAWALDFAPGEIVVLRPGSQAPARRRVPRRPHTPRSHNGVRRRSHPVEWIV